MIKKLFIRDVCCFRDVRCFVGRQELNIRPITFLVGENSTGKSTALGCFHVLHKFLFADDTLIPRLDFNCEPYQMGTFFDVVRRSKPVKCSFQMGFEFQLKKGEAPAEILLTLEPSEKTSEPIVQESRISAADDELVVKEMEAGAEQNDASTLDGFLFPEKMFLTLEKKEKGRRFTCSLQPSRNLLRAFILACYPHFQSFPKGILDRLPKEVQAWFSSLKASPLFHSLSFLRSLYYRHPPVLRHSSAHLGFPGVYSFAPIRSNTQRTYDPLRVDADSPDGSDTPMVLMSMAWTDRKEWDRLKEQLTEFGNTSGLFEGIYVKRFGRGTHYQFQLQITVKGPKVNLVDVGYGVGQLLPILVRVITDPVPRQFLLQQPEVHLHPRTQAELSSFLIDFAKEYGHSFIIETHNDYMVDRARIAIRKKKIESEDVSLIYFAAPATRFGCVTSGLMSRGIF